ncbi:uncharacterized protein LOC121055714 [Oryza brachyantha]|uniref:uncharacterized protein LOC121055714 n=1 Tax=Oryza brachyantha TaxID=4533 RepID=UPI001ADA1851|nr:uncharacterized protein LOC121055714 [Oryza brachyantha]
MDGVTSLSSLTFSRSTSSQRMSIAVYISPNGRWLFRSVPPATIATASAPNSIQPPAPALDSISAFRGDAHRLSPISVWPRVLRQAACYLGAFLLQHNFKSDHLFAR